MSGKSQPLKSASRKGTVSAFGGSCRVTALKCKSVPVGHCALMRADALWISAPLSGASGCEAVCVFGRSRKDAEEMDSVDMIVVGERVGWVEDFETMEDGESDALKRKSHHGEDACSRADKEGRLNLDSRYVGQRLWTRRKGKAVSRAATSPRMI